ncbi:MAG: DUF2184 domain-containing protein [bacterium]
MPIRFDAVRHHFDANETLFFARELESIEKTTYEFKEKELKYRKFVPVSNRDNPGAESITYHMLGKVGMARIISDYSHDLPRADVYGKEYTQSVKTVGISFGYNTQEIRAAIMANKPLDTMKADAARRALREKESSIVWTGDTEHNIIGLLNNPNIAVVASQNGAASSPTWALKTADEIINDVRIMTSRVRTQSKGVHNADTLLLPIDQYDILATKPRSVNSDTTVLEYLQKPGNSFGLTTIDWLPTELDNAFTGGTEDGAICYERSAEVLEQRIPLELQLLPIQAKGLEFVIPGESRHGGVVVRYPLAMVFFTGI